MWPVAPFLVPTPTLLLGTAAFLLTNIDDLVLLTALYAGRRMRGVAILAGQLLGMAALTGLAALGAGLALQLPPRAAALLGVVPLGLGLIGLLRLRRDVRAPAPRRTQRGTLAHAFGVAGLTLAGGGDNLATYIPLFAAHPAAVPTFAMLFLGLTLLWCLLAWGLVHSRPAARLLGGEGRAGRWLAGHSRLVLPAALTGIGLYILSGLA